ncbi:hypothetical protein [Stenotrophomonas maltophilia]|uniref:hypothetical protein n=1 Tax=Stenotrophomonas maltophilia TaxID=40324 RepID=UPI0015DF47D6|nr:hypothetical protein [Stenotrophomonas maltophilia]MBA0448701.1 hypothetical protein [Stenotrophomonas maltophilia]
MNNTPFTDEQQAEVRRRIVATAHDAGGMLTAAQLRDALEDVPAAERACAVLKLQHQGELETTGTGGAAIHSLVRLGQDAATVASAAPFALEKAKVTIKVPALMSPSASRQDDPIALRNRINAITQDLDEVLVDACSNELPHKAIQHLLDANRAARAAADTVTR